MNYNKIHDTIIDRARERVRDSSLYHNHHIIPLHEDKTSTDTVPLTIKEHYVVHHLRWKMVGTPGNLLAYRLIKNGQQDLEAWIEFGRENIKKGAGAWQEQSTPAQRSENSRKAQATKGPAGLSEAVRKGNVTRWAKYTPAQRSEWSTKAAATWLEQSTPAQRSERSKKGAATKKANKQLREASLDI